MLSGCDYLPSINGLGLKTAHKLLRKYKTVDKVLQYIRLETSLKIPKDYLKFYRIAELAFLHQKVYDPLSERLVHLHPIVDSAGWTPEMRAYVGWFVRGIFLEFSALMFTSLAILMTW